MSDLRIHLFGQVRVLLPNGRGEARLGRAARSLLAFLLLHRHRLHAREALSGEFWGDATQERARSCLSTALWRLRQVLEPPGVDRGAYLVTTTAGEVGWNGSSPHWLDVAAFEEVAKRVTAEPFHRAPASDAEQLEEALSLCRGELLEGHYEEWALSERDRLRWLHLESLTWLMHHHAFYGGYDRAALHGQEVLRREPAREEVHRELMRLYLESGQRSLAVRQYELCRAAVRRHFGTDPTAETHSLYSQALGTSGAVGTDGEGALDRLADRLEAAIRRFDEARDELREAVTLLLREKGGSGPSPIIRSDISVSRTVLTRRGEGAVTS